MTDHKQQADSSGHDAPASTGDDAHGHGHSDRQFEIIEENSSADGFLNFAAWFGVVALLAFSLIMVTARIQ